MTAEISRADRRRLEWIEEMLQDDPTRPEWRAARPLDAREADLVGLVYGDSVDLSRIQVAPSAEPLGIDREDGMLGWFLPLNPAMFLGDVLPYDLIVIARELTEPLPGGSFKLTDDALATLVHEVAHARGYQRRVVSRIERGRRRSRPMSAIARYKLYYSTVNPIRERWIQIWHGQGRHYAWWLALGKPWWRWSEEQRAEAITAYFEAVSLVREIPPSHIAQMDAAERQEAEEAYAEAQWVIRTLRPILRRAGRLELAGM